MPSAVSAGGCYANIASADLETYLAGGMTGEEAFIALQEDGNYDDSRKCFIKIRGLIKQFDIIRPYAYKLLFK